MQNGQFITMLGTGNALASRCYNTCFIIHTSGQPTLMVDAGGGNGILAQLEKADIPISSVSDLFITHAHTDHLLGCVWMVRMALQFKHPLRVWSHDKVLRVLTSICQEILPPKQAAGIGTLVELHCLENGERFKVSDLQLECFDIHSTKEKQFGFMAVMPDGQRLCCLGDEPFCEENARYAEHADWLLCEAFCLYADRDRFHPYEKHHSTVLDAAQLAERLLVKNLLLYHTEDKTLDNRRERYTAEAKSVYTGNVWVPNDLETIML